jgi:hypothetical protein
MTVKKDIPGAGVYGVASSVPKNSVCRLLKKDLRGVVVVIVSVKT